MLCESLQRCEGEWGPVTRVPLGVVGIQLCKWLILGIWSVPLEPHKALLFSPFFTLFNYKYSKIHPFYCCEKHIVMESRYGTVPSPLRFPLHPFVLHPAHGNHWFFSVPRVLPFPECYISRSILYVVFWVWLLSHSMMHILVICCCFKQQIINIPQTWWLKIENIYYLAVFVFSCCCNKLPQMYCLKTTHIQGVGMYFLISFTHNKNIMML